MRFPRASAVIVALSTFVAVATVGALVSQLSPLDRAGALLPDGPIVTTGQPVDGEPADETASPVDDPAPGASDAAAPNSAEGGVTVVDPAPAEPVTPDPEPSPSPNPGNGGNPSGQPESPGNSGNPPGQGKP